MTFEQAISEEIERMDKAWAEYRALVCDLEHLNLQSQELKETAKKLSRSQQQIFTLKLVLDHTLQQTNPNP